jgi:outer membrane protein OmpA-like peptidoglycan-associated protein
MKHVLVLVMSVLLAACAGGGIFGPRETPDKFIAFFNFDSVMLSPEARAVVHQAAVAAKTMHAMHIELAGFTGREEEARTDDRVAAQRFAAIEEALVAEGVDRALLKRVALVDTVPLPATAVRRIEIRLMP